MNVKIIEDDTDIKVNGLSEVVLSEINNLVADIKKTNKVSKKQVSSICKIINEPTMNNNSFLNRFTNIPSNSGVDFILEYLNNAYPEDIKSIDKTITKKEIVELISEISYSIKRVHGHMSSMIEKIDISVVEKLNDEHLTSYWKDDVNGDEVLTKIYNESITDTYWLQTKQYKNIFNNDGIDKVCELNRNKLIVPTFFLALLQNKLFIFNFNTLEIADVTYKDLTEIVTSVPKQLEKLDVLNKQLKDYINFNIDTVEYDSVYPLSTYKKMELVKEALDYEKILPYLMLYMKK